MLAGILKLPAKSLPIPKALPPAASKAHSPPDEPPGVLKKLQIISKFHATFRNDRQTSNGRQN